MYKILLRNFEVGYRGIISDFFWWIGKISKKFRQNSQGIRILTYHSIQPTNISSPLIVSPERFREQMIFIKQAGYETLNLKDALNIATKRKSHNVTPKIVVTFDDGYTDNHKYALPILKNLELTATFFVVPGFVGKKNIESRDWPLMHWTQIQDLTGEGMEIGSHSMSHIRLHKLSVKQQCNEIYHSKLIIEEKINHSVDFFCYPGGKYSTETEKIVCGSGYKGACSCIPGLANFRKNLFFLKRTDIYQKDDLNNFIKKIEGAYDIPHKIQYNINRILESRSGWFKK